MPRRSDRPTRPVSFRMPLEAYEVFEAFVNARGMDLSSLLNWCCAAALPVLTRQDAELKATLEKAVQALREYGS